METPRSTGGTGSSGDTTTAFVGSEHVKAVRFDRLTTMAVGAEDHETREWSLGAMEYFAVMRSIRTDPELWFGGSSNGKIRAEQISKSIRNAVTEYRENRRGARS
jgi:hypothetical protein